MRQHRDATQADEDVLVAKEVERLRDEVIRPRARSSESIASANKEWILTVVADATRRGERKVAPPELVLRLRERFGYEPRVNANTGMAMRKALFDIARVAREWYEGHPDHLFCVLLSTSGRVDVFTEGLPKSTDDDAPRLQALRKFSKDLPRVARELTDILAVRPMVEVPFDNKRDERLQALFKSDAIEGTSVEDRSLMSSLLYAWTSYGIEMALRAFDGQVIAVERHPTHDMAAWNGPLEWLDDAYRDYRLTKREIIRLVVLEDEARAKLIEDRDFWNEWVSHIQGRLVTDQVRVVLNPLPDWKEAVTRDLLILPDVLAMEFERDGFPFNGRAHHGSAARLITTAARAAAATPSGENIFHIVSTRSDECFEELWRKLNASLPTAARRA